jgi:hypothetical protein
MAAFYDLVGTFDARIIFHEHERLGLDGYRWAPASFLHQPPDIIVYRDTQDQSSVPLAQAHTNGQGLFVQLPGLEFETSGPEGLLQPGSVVYFKPRLGPSSITQPYPMHSPPPPPSWPGGVGYPQQMYPTTAFNPGAYPIPHPPFPHAAMLQPMAWTQPWMANHNPAAYYPLYTPTTQLPPRKLAWWEHTYRVEIPPQRPGADSWTTAPWALAPRRRYGILLPPLCFLGPQNLPVTAALGVIQDLEPGVSIDTPMPGARWTTVGTPGNQVPDFKTLLRVPIRYLSPVKVEAVLAEMAPRLQGARFVSGIAFSHDQDWCVR